MARRMQVDSDKIGPKDEAAKQNLEQKREVKAVALGERWLRRRGRQRRLGGVLCGSGGRLLTGGSRGIAAPRVLRASRQGWEGDGSRRSPMLLVLLEDWDPVLSRGTRGNQVRLRFARVPSTNFNTQFLI